MLWGCPILHPHGHTPAALPGAGVPIAHPALGSWQAGQFPVLQGGEGRCSERLQLFSYRWLCLKSFPIALLLKLWLPPHSLNR